ncbi:glycosyl hydrolase [Membranihabitans maritimus]|uniref:glycosyl hydrolase n=1 Tax=Membranihabitans maritimus TaxID=2904244 RepID=UPI001F3ED1BA|nr:glycosyl hydrolase [Membranihabitans maritimus]
MPKYILLVLITLLSIDICGQTDYSLKTKQDISFNDLDSGFQNPPPGSRLRCYWWWLNGMATKESITRDLEEMKAKGYGGASIVDAGSSSYDIAHKTKAGPVFMSPNWMDLYQHAVKEADRIGIELSVNVQSGWNPGAPTITPEMAVKKLVYSEAEVAGGQRIQMELPLPDSNLIYRDVMVQAIPLPPEGAPVKNDAILYWEKKSFNKPMGWKGIYPLHQLREMKDSTKSTEIIRKSDIIDLTGQFDGDQLIWEVPSGNWLVIRYGWTCTGARTSTTSDGWSGLSLDHLNPDAFELFRKTVIQPLIDAAKVAGNSVKFLQTDSWEMGTTNWTNRFPEEFKKLRGYDLDKFMPVLTGRIVAGRELSNRFLHDIRKTVGDCVINNHYKLFAELAHEHGMGIHPESGGPHSAPVDALQVMAESDFPQGEFWARSNTHRVSDAARLAVKQSACVAHTNGKRIVAAEGPTSIGPQWERAPKDLKANIDRIFCSGINRIVWHTFTSSPEEFGRPGNEYFAGTHLNPHVTWWDQADDFIDYLNRSSFMLQQGLFVADVLYYYGDDVPNFVFLKEEYPELDFGYDWDKCSRDVMLERVSFSNNEIILPDGMSYRLLVMAPEQSVDLEVLKKIKVLVEQGMTVVAPPPGATTGLSDYPKGDRELNDIAEKLWGDIDGETITENKYGKGRVIWGQDVNSVLADMNVRPDFEFISPDPKTELDYIHRTTNENEIYFVVNKYARKGINDFEYRYLSELPDRFEKVECKFRESGKIPYLFDPNTGEKKQILTYREENGYITLPLHFPPEGSYFVVFADGEMEDHIVSIEKDGESLFPGNSFAARKNPYIDFEMQEGEWQTCVYETGYYTLEWSDGKVHNISLNEEMKKVPLTGSWDVEFDTSWGGPGKVGFDELKSWTKFEDPRIRYYSGAAVYTKKFSIKKSDWKSNKALLNLGNLHAIAEVTLNGHQFYANWFPPYEIDATEYLRDGENTLSIKIVNLWPNRLVGDGKLPKEDRLTQTNIVKFNGPGADKFLRVSGLLGPVDLKFPKVEQSR